MNSRIVGLLTRIPSNLKAHGATDDELDGFVARTHVALPTPLRDWLKLSNGPTFGEGGWCGVRSASKPNIDIERLYRHELFSSWQRRGWVPVSSNGCGSYYGVPTQNDFGDGYPVLFFDHEIDFDHPQYVVSSAIEMFVQFMLEKELGETLWPFDKAYVLEIDPQIVRVRGAPLPWCVE